MSAKNVVLLFIALAAITAAGVIMVNRSGDSMPAEESMNRMVYLVCQNADCKHEFEMTAREHAKAKSSGGPPECPDCGQRKNRLGHKCEQCSRIVMRIGHAELPPECPHCGFDFAADPEALRKVQEDHEALDRLTGADGG